MDEIAPDSTDSADDQTGPASIVGADSTGASGSTDQDRAQDDDSRINGLMKVASKKQNVIDAQREEIEALKAEVERLALEDYPPPSNHAALPELDAPTQDTANDDESNEPPTIYMQPNMARRGQGISFGQPPVAVAAGLDRLVGSQDITALRTSAAELNRRWAEEQREQGNL